MLSDLTLADLGNIALMVQAIVVIVSIGFIWYQLRETTRLTRAANTQKLVELSSPFNLQLIENRELAQFWVQGGKNWSTMDEVDKYRYRSLVVWWLILHENIYYQWQKKLIDEETYTSWANDLKVFVVEQNLEQNWDEWKTPFQPSFQEHVHQLIEGHRKQRK